jgi:hypothetical protein
MPINNMDDGQWRASLIADSYSGYNQSIKTTDITISMLLKVGPIFLCFGVR